MKKSILSTALLALATLSNANAELTNVDYSCNSVQWEQILEADRYATNLSRRALNLYLNNPANGLAYFGQATLSEAVVGQLLKLYTTSGGDRKYRCMPHPSYYHTLRASDRTIEVGSYFWFTPLRTWLSDDPFQVKILVAQWMDASFVLKAPPGDYSAPPIINTPPPINVAPTMNIPLGHQDAMNIAVAWPAFAQTNTDNYALYVTDPYGVVAPFAF